MVADLAAAAITLRDALGAEQRDRLCLPFDEIERRTWFYWPAPRKGVPLGDLDGSQVNLVHELVTAMVSTPTLAKVTTILGLEIVLADLEEQGLATRGRPDGFPRDPTAYATTLFGDPGSDEPWGVRFEGHHVSLHATVFGGRLAQTPFFLGANPAVVGRGEHVVLRPLGEEEDVARSLLGSLSSAERRRAVIDDTAPADIVTANAARVEDDLEAGLALADLRDEARGLAEHLVRLHVERLRHPVPAPAIDDLHFAWAGETDLGRPHYYRVAGPRFLVEYDNTQNDANHAHSVWRDPAGDFGDDLLRGHHAAQH